ncbi:MAG: lysostaphin resistance A-like protein [Longimicrobiales bacterium]
MHDIPMYRLVHLVVDDYRQVQRTVRGLAIAIVTTVVCLGLGVAVGRIAPEPKWPHLGWLWALNNLLLVCMTEEAVFRGYLQGELSRRFSGVRHGDILAIGIAATLFGLAHAAGGIGLIVVAGLAGVGYGLAYRVGGLQAAVLAHFGLNLTHFTLFTYPLLAG